MTDRVVYTILLHEDLGNPGIMFRCVGDENDSRTRFRLLRGDLVERLGDQKCDLAVYNDHHAESLIRACLTEIFDGEFAQIVIETMRITSTNMGMELQPSG